MQGEIDTLPETIAELRSLWVQHKAIIERRQRFYPVSKHRCMRGFCRLVTIPIIECYRDEETYLIRYCLGQPLCQKQHVPEECAHNLHMRVCDQTGNVHFCGDICDRARLSRKEGDNVCDLTGIVVAERRVTTGLFGDYIESHGYVMPTAMTRELTTETLHDRMFDLAGVRLARAEKTYASHYAQFVVFVAGVFSKERFDAEDRELYKQEDGVVRALEKYITAPPRMFPDVIRMVQIAAAMRRRHARTVRVSLGRDRVAQIVPGYARRVIALFAILRRYVPGGRDVTRVNLRDFTLAALELCETGVVVRDRRNTHDIQILPRDSLLSVVPVSQEAHMVVKKSYKSLSQLKFSIITAFQTAVNARVDPSLLRVDIQSSHVHLFPSDVFEDLPPDTQRTESASAAGRREDTPRLLLR